jgi:hypothetical protein
LHEINAGHEKRAYGYEKPRGEKKTGNSCSANTNFNNTTNTHFKLREISTHKTTIGSS